MTETRVVPVTWSCAAMHDPTCRRGLWFTESLERGHPTTDIIIVAGREGNDARFEIRVGEVMTQAKLDDLRNCLISAAWVQEDHRGFIGVPMEYPVMNSWEKTLPKDIPQMIEGDGKESRTLVTIGPWCGDRSARFLVRTSQEE